MPSTRSSGHSRSSGHAQPALRRGPVIVTVAALVVLLVAALGGLGIISVPDSAARSSSDPASSGDSLADAAPLTAQNGTPTTTPPTVVPGSTVAPGSTATSTPTSSAAATPVAALGADFVATQPDGFRLALGTFFDALAEPAEDAPTSAPVVPAAGQTTPPPVVDSTALPPNSGSGKRAVYAITAQRVWLVEEDGTVSRTYRVSGRLDRPGVGQYEVYSRSPNAVSYNYTERMKYMVRFAHGATAAIGFHDIPIDKAGNPVQTTEQLGQPLSAGCVRQSEDDAIALWNWAPVGTTVVVLA